MGRGEKRTRAFKVMDLNPLTFSFGDVPVDGGDTDTGLNGHIRKFMEDHAEGR